MGLLRTRSRSHTAEPWATILDLHEHPCALGFVELDAVQMFDRGDELVVGLMGVFPTCLGLAEGREASFEVQICGRVA